MVTRPKVLDLFCGAGGLSVGLMQAGFEVAAAMDNNSAALSTYRSNVGPHATHFDLSREADFPDVDVIAGGPPCQGFSSAGLREHGDSRNSLVGRFARVIVERRPKAFLFENVEGFLTAEGGARVFELLNPLIEAGYRIHLRKVNAANYGVPQHRKRVIAIGGLGWTPGFPAPTHTAFGAPGAHLASRDLPAARTVADALSSLPPPTTAPPGVPQGHFARPLEAEELRRAVALLAGQTMRDLPEEFHHPSYARRAKRRVMDGTASERRGGPPSGVRRLRWDAPSKAITGGAKSEFLHPLENRYLTLRECARLQSFTDDFIFHGSASEQSQLIGNAVPPLFAEVLGRSLEADLRAGWSATDVGALLSFVPTLADGASPVLRHVTARVQMRFLEHGQGSELTLW